MSKALRFRSLYYRAGAVVANSVNKATWPYLWERLKRRVAGGRPDALSRSEVLETYGPAFKDVETALRMVSAGATVEDPRVAYADDFAVAERDIASLGIPFHELGIAGSSDLVLLHSVVRAVRPRRMLETGVALGWSSLVLLKAAQQNGGRLISTDMPYPLLRGTAWVGTAVPEYLRRNWTLLRTSDRLGLPIALSMCDAFDLIHYDSDKTERGRRWAYPRLWDALAPGGVMISDDIDDTSTWAEFCTERSLPLIVVKRTKKCAGIARKGGDT